jgi:hypothetical protein
MKRLVVELVAQTVMALLVATVAGFTALITAVPLGGAAFGVAPEAHLNLVSGLLCPAGSQVVFIEGRDVVTYSGGTPSYGTAITVACEAASGVRTEIPGQDLFGPLFGGIGLVLGGYFLVCFGPLFLLGLLAGGFITHKLVGSLLARQPAAPPPVTL